LFLLGAPMAAQNHEQFILTCVPPCPASIQQQSADAVSPSYLAQERPDGQDGETLKLYNRNGMLLWQGFNGILSRDGLSVIVDCDDMRNMRWDDDDILHVDVYRGGKQPITLSLTRRGDGKWEWLPKITQ